MLLALLLMTRAAAEWVEISQQHYRKPVRVTSLDNTRNTHQDVLRNPLSNAYQDVLQTSIRETYHNQNIQNSANNHDLRNSEKIFTDHDVLTEPMRDDFREHEASSNPTKYSDRDVKPVRLNPFLHEVSSISPVRITKIETVLNPTRDSYFNKKLESTMEDAYLNRSIADHTWNQDWNKNTPKHEERNKLIQKNNVPNTVKIKDETISGKIERVSNLGSVKRVQLADTPIKSPVLNNKTLENVMNFRNNNHGAHNYNSFSDELETNIFNEHVDSVSKLPSNNAKEKPSGMEKVTLNNTYNERPKRPTQSSFQRNPFTHYSDNTVIVKNGVSESIKSSADQSIVNQAKPFEDFVANEGVLHDFVTKNDKFIDNEEIKPNMELDQSRKKHRGSVKTEKVHDSNEEISSENNENTKYSSSEVKVNTMENLLKFMKVVADTISKNTRKAHGKITYLNELKHTLLANIKDRIDATWPDDAAGVASRRHSRAAAARGHVEFPSSESALMTISFLTFAVFLIKLVLQVIQTYKHKTMVMAPLMVATAGRTVTKKLRDHLNLN